MSVGPAEISITYATFLQVLQTAESVIQVAPGRLLVRANGTYRAYNISDVSSGFL